MMYFTETGEWGHINGQNPKAVMEKVAKEFFDQFSEETTYNTYKITLVDFENNKATVFKFVMQRTMFITEF